MPIHSMTGFAQVKGQVNNRLGFTLLLKSVNHRFLDVHLRLPPESDALEIKIRRVLKEKLARGHVDVALSVQSAEEPALSINRPLVRGYMEAFRALARESGISSEPDLNAILRLPGALEGTDGAGLGEEMENAVLAGLEEAVRQLNGMRAEEGRGIVRELRERLAALDAATRQIGGLREAVARAYLLKIQARMEELIGGRADTDRILQEAALLAERSDIQEEVVRLQTHIQHFLGVLDQGGEAGKKLDFLSQEMNREANTLLSKSGGAAGDALRITETGLAMKAEIEKIREQVQNLE